MCSERIKIGHQCCRIAITTMILSEILDWPIIHPRVVSLVERLAEQLEACRESPAPYCLAPETLTLTRQRARQRSDSAGHSS